MATKTECNICNMFPSKHEDGRCVNCVRPNSVINFCTGCGRHSTLLNEEFLGTFSGERLDKIKEALPGGITVISNHCPLCDPERKEDWDISIY